MARQRGKRRACAIALCLAASLLLHAGAAWLVLQVPRPQLRQKSPVRTARLVQVLRTPKPKRKPAAPQPPPQQQEEPHTPAFAKTNPDMPQETPEHVDYRGKRDTRAASAPDSQDLRSDRNAPAMTGREQEELVTFDETRQDGPLEQEGRKQPRESAPRPQQQAEADFVSMDTPPPAPGLPTTEPQPQTKPGTDAAELTRRGALTVNPIAEETENGIHLNPAELPSLSPQELHAAPRGLPDSPGRDPRSITPPKPKRRRAVYDPSLADHMQAPGFRTNENRTRSTGRFTLGRGAALNVANTPQGQYEAEVYRRIAHSWYMACDDHRGDIIPGTVSVSLRLHKSGRIANMDLIRRRGASVSQQSFTFGAIRRASLPPMPPAVQKAVVGDVLELVFDFNFD